MGKVERAKVSWHGTCKIVAGFEKQVSKFEASTKVTPDEVQKVKVSRNANPALPWW